jgi:hypothetical protein
MSRKIEIDTTICELEVEVSASITPFIKGKMHLKNGDPGYPDEGGDIEDLEIKLVRYGTRADGKKYRFYLNITDFVSKNEKESIEQELMESLED